MCVARVYAILSVLTARRVQNASMGSLDVNTSQQNMLVMVISNQLRRLLALETCGDQAKCHQLQQMLPSISVGQACVATLIISSGNM